MVRINTFVIFDMETTGLPQLERNETKATEMCFVAVSRRDLKRTPPQGGVISTTKLSFMLNPMRQISPGAVSMNGITNDVVKYAPTFQHKIKGIIQFFQELPQPVCLVAHNGNAFDYKILQAECYDIEEMLPPHIYCIDSLPAFRQLEKDYQKQPRQGMSRFLEGMVTDDEEEEEEDDEILRQIFQLSRQRAQSRPIDFKLQSVYERMYGSKFNGAHRAEGDCQMLLDCILAYQSNNADFVQWANDNCKLFCDIRPLNRQGYADRDRF